MFRTPLAAALVLAVAGCSQAPRDQAASPAHRPPGDTPSQAPASHTAPTVPAPPDSPFAAAPAQGHVVRANCRMGGCWWYRLDTVQVEGTAPPSYRLQVRVGDSGPHPDPYPLDPAGVDIRWDAHSSAAVIECSIDAPMAGFAGDRQRLPLNPQGVSGVEQGIASLYFFVCHRAVGPDDALAVRYGYNVRQR